jgi:hypothetical protein
MDSKLLIYRNYFLKHLFLSLLISFNLLSFSQISLKCNGLSNEYKEKFENKKIILDSLIRQIEIPNSAYPINIVINYYNGKGQISLMINYIHDDFFSIERNKKFNDNYRKYAKGINLFFVHEFMNILSAYKFEVAKKGFNFDQDIIDFENCIELKNGANNLKIFAYNFFSKIGPSYQYEFYPSLSLYYNGILYDVEVYNFDLFNVKKDFEIGKIIGLDGKPTPYYYFSKFFKLEERRITQNNNDAINVIKDSSSYANDNQVLKNKRIRSLNFQIPVKPEKYVDIGTIPDIHDKNLKSISFSSSAVLFKNNGGSLNIDNQSKWTLFLNLDNFHLSNANGFDRSLRIIDNQYDEKMKMQKFILGNSNNEITHNLLISWSNRDKDYNIIFCSTNEEEMYQFQESQSFNKQYQNIVIEKNMNQSNLDKENKHNEIIESDMIEISKLNNIWYGTQILASKTNMNPDDKSFKNFKPIYYLFENGYFKYFVGLDRNWQRAKNSFQDIKSKFDGSFLVCFENGEKKAFMSSIKDLRGEFTNVFNGDCLHLLFLDEKGKKWDFGASANAFPYKVYSYNVDNDKFSIDKNFIGKKVTITIADLFGIICNGKSSYDEGKVTYELIPTIIDIKYEEGFEKNGSESYLQYSSNTSDSFDQISKSQRDQIAQINRTAKNIFDYKDNEIVNVTEDGQKKNNDSISFDQNNRRTGISYNQLKRKVITAAKPSYPGNEEGIVVVNIKVDRLGIVKEAEIDTIRTNTLNRKLWEPARVAALSTTFDSDMNAPEFQNGTISYRFVLE